MTQLFETVARFAKEEDGASATEYAILVAIIAAIVLAAVKLFDLNNIFGTAGNKVKGCVNNAGPNGSC